jgi:hypothetical protein
VRKFLAVKLPDADWRRLQRFLELHPGFNVSDCLRIGLRKFLIEKLGPPPGLVGEPMPHQIVQPELDQAEPDQAAAAELPSPVAELPPPAAAGGHKSGSKPFSSAAARENLKRRRKADTDSKPPTRPTKPKAPPAKKGAKN